MDGVSDATGRTAHASNLVAGIKQLVAGTHSDFIITCGAREWKVHKIILRVTSPVLEKSCFGGFKVWIHMRTQNSDFADRDM
jgi:hypothetical protein